MWLSWSFSVKSAAPLFVLSQLTAAVRSVFMVLVLLSLENQHKLHRFKRQMLSSVAPPTASDISGSPSGTLIFLELYWYCLFFCCFFLFWGGGLGPAHSWWKKGQWHMLINWSSPFKLKVCLQKQLTWPRLFGEWLLVVSKWNWFKKCIQCCTKNLSDFFGH